MLHHCVTSAFLFISSALLYAENSPTQEEDVLQYVDPMIGTAGKGHTFPGATTPLGMIQLTPSDRDHIPGYNYAESVMPGFAHNHYSGTGLGAMGDILLIPTHGDVKINPGTKENPDIGYASRFSHEKESASAGYYSVDLLDYDIKVELTCTKRVGYHRYTFRKEGRHNVLIDPLHNIRENLRNARIEVISDTEVIGFKHSQSGACGIRHVYFYAQFSKPFKEHGVHVPGKIIKNGKVTEGKASRAYFTFNTEANEVVEVKVALSHVSQKGARQNFAAEAKDKNFDQVHQDARALWRDKLSRISIKDESVKNKRIFYTGLYHSFIAPNTISDVNGDYYIEGKVRKSPNVEQLSNISTWDTYRATHPLWTIIDQKSDAQLVNVLTSRHTEAGVGLALWEGLGFDNFCMIGYSGISVMADAVLKEIKGISPEDVYQTVKAASFETDSSSPNYGHDNGVDDYIMLNGWIPAEVGSSVSKTTEYNYYDWCVAELAKKLGKTKDEDYFRKRSLGYRNLYHKEQNFLWPKTVNGEWISMGLTGWEELQHNYISGNIWSYSGYTPHDMAGAIQLWGGKEAYATWLDKIFGTEIKMEGEQHFDISGFIGGYAHGDEPGHQMPYSYLFVDQAWKTQELIREIMKVMYDDTPMGFINNEDCGQMSSWYIFSALGFYPVCPGDLKYYVGSPIFDEATLNLENGKKFTVKTLNDAENNQYIHSMTVNGKPRNEPFLTHAEIMSGGSVTFEMGAKPNKNWGNMKN